MNPYKQIKQNGKNKISEKDKQEIIEYLSNEYSIEKTSIIIH